jgi:hypothetical protein
MPKCGAKKINGKSCKNPAGCAVEGHPEQRAAKADAKAAKATIVNLAVDRSSDQVIRSDGDYDSDGSEEASDMEKDGDIENDSDEASDIERDGDRETMIIIQQTCCLCDKALNSGAQMTTILCDCNHVEHGCRVLHSRCFAQHCMRKCETAPGGIVLIADCPVCKKDGLLPPNGGYNDAIALEVAKGLYDSILPPVAPVILDRFANWAMPNVTSECNHTLTVKYPKAAAAAAGVTVNAHVIYEQAADLARDVLHNCAQILRTTQKADEISQRTASACTSFVMTHGLTTDARVRAAARTAETTDLIAELERNLSAIGF